ncbi:diguanylate cyclase domain-containing protein [Crocosphaera sp. XPORK-15E]|uniref:diguanylate cyclase domain-containing protein n=1 Tax=Crocosphaera sp. XPORK-15E TaxID=3110247 RepID=UPI002B1FDCF5|nr:diguanylate cyclase [Crocosphaera sp. XPORK-15E]MEA5535441.1 diguanylate cyclase [Crocosphaera sp. XPORK-15E]
MGFPVNTMIKKLIHPQYRDHLKVGQNWLIRDISQGVDRFSNSPNALKSGQDIRDVFPEIRGLESILSDVFHGKRISYEIKHLCRHSSQQSLHYFNLYFLLDQNSDHQLLVLVEEARESLHTLQKMTQITKETLLSVQEKEKFLGIITQQIWRSLKLEDVLKLNITQIRQKLDCCRVLIYQVHNFQKNWYGRIITETVAPGCKELLDQEFNNPTLHQNWGQLYRDQEVFQIEDINHYGLEESWRKTLQDNQIDSQLVIPIWISDAEAETSFEIHLWGLLIIHHHTPRYWYKKEIQMVKNLSEYLTISIQLERLAIIDYLTHLPNRRAFNSQLQQEWERLAREKQPLALILCDVDYFSRFNKTYGHLSGDHCLRQIASILAKSIKRSADTAARYGGEEFAIILPNTEIEGAYQVAEKVRQEINALKIPHQESPKQYVTISLGVASYIPNTSLTIETLIQAADNALLAAKQAGRDCTIKH